MNRRLAVAGLAVVLVSGSVAALIADPLATAPERDAVDATAESPGALVLAALDTEDRRSYDVRYVVGHSSDDRPFVFRKRVDRHHHRAAVVERQVPRREPNAQWFLGECSAAARISTDVSIGHSKYANYADPFYTEGVDPSDLDATVVDRADGQVVVRVENTSAAVSVVTERPNPPEWVREEGLRGNLTVTWNADEGVLDRVAYVSTSRVNETHRETFRRTWEFRAWGHVHVDRPPWAGYTHQEFLCDVRTLRT